MARIFIDTNIWARRLEKQSPLSPVARGALSKLTARGDELVIAPQTLYELWTVATRPATARGGLGYSPEAAARILASLSRSCLVLADGAALLPEWQRLVTIHRVIGAAAHDARLVAAMKVHGVAQILTFNGKDFTRYAPEGITVVDPASI